MRSLKISLSLLIITGLIFFTSCGSSEVYNPKPKGYNHIDLPVHSYQQFSDEEIPYSFEYSTEATLIDDTIGISDTKWKKLYYPKFGSEIDITYKDVKNSPERLDSLIRTSHKLADKHLVKAESRSVEEILLANGSKATLIHIGGDIPSTLQAFTHDSTDHFLRCSLYFPTAVKNDSLQPVIDYCIEDVIHLLNTLEWKEP